MAWLALRMHRGHPAGERERCGRIRFRAHAALHKADQKDA